MLMCVCMCACTLVLCCSLVLFDFSPSLTSSFLHTCSLKVCASGGKFSGVAYLKKEGAKEKIQARQAVKAKKPGMLHRQKSTLGSRGLEVLRDSRREMRESAGRVGSVELSRSGGEVLWIGSATYANAAATRCLVR
jgi:hypothetical protein